MSTIIDKLFNFNVKVYYANIFSLQAELIYLVINILGPSIRDIEHSNHEAITLEFIYITLHYKVKK